MVWMRLAGTLGGPLSAKGSIDSVKKLALFIAAVSAPFAALAAQPETATEAAPARQDRQEAATPAEQSAGTPAGERRICRRVDTTGSRTGGQRVCMTAEEWRRADF